MEISTNPSQNQTLSNELSSDFRTYLYVDRISSFVARSVIWCLECGIWLHIGAVAGWISGWCIALAYKYYCQPTRFISIDVMRKWHYLPYEYGRGGLLAGAIIGTVAVIMLMIIKSTIPIETKGN